MSTHQLENEKPVRLTVSKDDKVAIQQRAGRVGKQLGEAAVSLISEIMIAFMSGKIKKIVALSPYFAIIPLFQILSNLRSI
jgi:hypothetical protein